jgi:hypothetical protein
MRKFIPGYAQLVAPIQALAAAGSNEWSAECAASRNAVCEILSKRVQLMVPDCAAPFYIYLDAGALGVSAVVA